MENPFYDAQGNHAGNLLPSLIKPYIIGKTIGTQMCTFENIAEFDEGTEEEPDMNYLILSAFEYEVYVADSKPSGQTNFSIPENCRSGHFILNSTFCSELHHLNFIMDIDTN